MKIVLSITCLVLASCLSADLAVPSGSLIVCESDSDCPAEYICSVGLGTCIDTATQDFIQPAFVPGTFSVNPQVARIGTVITVAFEVTELLAAIPVVKLGDPGPEFTLSAGQPPEYVFAYTVIGSEAEAGLSIAVHLIDRVGNEATLGGMTVTLDFTDPTVTTSSPLPSSPVTVDDTVTATFTVSEPLSKVPDVWLMTPSPQRFTQDTAASDYTFNFVVTGDVPSGATNVRVDLTDVAGNDAEVVIGSVTVQ